MSQKRFEKALADVSRVFQSPAEIVEAADLTAQQKVALLKQWDTDLRLKMVASEENMAETGSDQTAELLQSVEESLTRLGVEKKEGDRAPNKTGGA
jgi:hypothetical protein